MISVSDTGVGIPEAELPYIFDRFYQVRNWEEEKPGSGIGLHLVREYAVLHGGKVTVESHPGQGSTFTVYLPVDLKPEGEQLETVESILRKVKERTRHSKKPLSRHRRTVMTGKGC